MTPTTTARMPSGQIKPARESATFEYTTYICTTPEKLWAALTLNELRKHWWRGHTVETDWQVGSTITSCFPDGSPEFQGHVVEADRPRSLAFEVDEIFWSDEFARDPSRVSFTIEGFGPLARLTLRNEASPKMIKLVGDGWPAVLSSLKSLLETGNPLPLDVVFGPERNPGAAPSNGLFVERTLEIRAPATRVWQALTDPALTRQWIREFSPDFTLLESTWILGSPVLWKDNQNQAPVEGKVTTSDPPRLLRFTVRDPTGRRDFLSEPDDGISYVVTEQDGRTTLAISHGDFGRDAGHRQYYEQSAAAWDRVLPIVKRLAEQPA